MVLSAGPHQIECESTLSQIPVNLKELSQSDYTKISLFLIGEIMKISIFKNPSHNVPRLSGNVYMTPGPPYDSLGHVFRWGQAKLGSSVSWEVIENVQKSNENQ